MSKEDKYKFINNLSQEIEKKIYEFGNFDVKKDTLYRKKSRMLVLSLKTDNDELISEIVNG